MRLFRSIVPGIAFAVAAPGAAAQTSPPDSAVIHGISREFSAAYLRGDADAMAGAYTVDGVIFPDRSEMITGREAIRKYWALQPGNRVTRHVATPTRIVVEDGIAYDYGVYEIAGTREGKPWGPSHGKYVIVWRRDGATWRIQLDMWNSRPAPGS